MPISARDPSDSVQPFAGDAARKYDRWYQTPWGAYADQRERELLVAMARPRAGERVLDVGCGTGRYVRWLAEMGLDAFGVDLSADMLSIARRSAREAGSGGRLARADAARLPFEDGAFDLACATTVLEFVADPEAVVREMARVSRGRLFLGVLNARSSWGRRLQRDEHGILGAARLFAPTELEDLVRRAIPRTRLAARTTLLAPPECGPVLRWIGRIWDSVPAGRRILWGAYIGLSVDLRANGERDTQGDGG